MVVTNITNGVNLLNAGLRIEASTEFRDEQRNAVSLGVLGSGAHSQLMPCLAFSSLFNRWFTSGAHISSKLAAVSVVIKDLSGGVLATAWCLSETQVENEAT